MTNSIETLKELVSTIKGISFVSFEYTNSQGELSNYLLNLGISYGDSKAKDILYLKGLSFDDPLLEQARLELLASAIKPEQNRSKAQAEAYEHLTNNIKVHIETGKTFIYGYLVSKKVLVPAIETEKTDTRKQLTKAKDGIRKDLKHCQYRQFNVGQIRVAKVLGETLYLSE